MNKKLHFAEVGEAEPVQFADLFVGAIFQDASPLNGFGSGIISRKIDAGACEEVAQWRDGGWRHIALPAKWQARPGMKVWRYVDLNIDL